MKGYHDLVGDGGSRILEQVVAQQERIAKNLAGVRHLVAIGSGKGGVGKSTLTLQLASALRGRGREIAVLDADFNGPSQARLAGVRDVMLVPGPDRVSLPRTRSGIGVFSMGTLVPEEEALQFESVALGESYTWRATREFALLAEILASLDWGRLDFLLIDLPPGAERTFQYAEFFGPATAFVLVTIPSDLARGVVARSVAALRNTPNRTLGYIENMSGYFCADCGKVKPLFSSSEARDLGIPLLGTVPFDPELARMCDRGIPITEHPDAPSAHAVEAVATRIVESLEGAS